MGVFFFGSYCVFFFNFFVPFDIHAFRALVMARAARALGWKRLMHVMYLECSFCLDYVVVRVLHCCVGEYRPSLKSRAARHEAYCSAMSRGDR